MRKVLSLGLVVFFSIVFVALGQSPADNKKPEAAVKAPESVALDAVSKDKIQAAIAVLSENGEILKKANAELAIAIRRIADAQLTIDVAVRKSNEAQTTAQTTFEAFLTKNSLKKEEWEFDANKMVVTKRAPEVVK